MGQLSTGRGSVRLRHGKRRKQSIVHRHRHRVLERKWIENDGRLTKMQYLTVTGRNEERLSHTKRHRNSGYDWKLTLCSPLPLSARYFYGDLAGFKSIQEAMTKADGYSPQDTKRVEKEQTLYRCPPKHVFV